LPVKENGKGAVPAARAAGPIDSLLGPLLSSATDWAERPKPGPVLRGLAMMDRLTSTVLTGATFRATYRWWWYYGRAEGAIRDI